MKILKKSAVIFMILALLTLGLSGCDKRGACEECGQVETLKKFVEDDGDEHWLCNDCYRLYKLFE